LDEKYKMVKLLRTSVNSIDYGSVEYGKQSSVRRFDITLDDDTDESVTVDSIDFPEHVVGKFSTDSEYSESIVGTFVIPYKIFLYGTKYFMNTDDLGKGKVIPIEPVIEPEKLGYLCETGIYVGTGQSDKRLLVDIQICLQDEGGYILEDEFGNFLEDN
jgi:hypothetical protein